MSELIAGYKLGAELCKVLGLDPKTTRRVVIVADVEDVARVYVEQYVDKVIVNGVLTTLDKYKPAVEVVPNVVVEDGKVTVTR